MKALILALAIVMAATSAMAANVDLAWDYDGPSDHTFKVHWGAVAGKYPNAKDSGTAKQIKIDSLQPGQTYHFVATAHTPQGLSSEYSEPLAVHVPLAPIELRIVVNVPGN